MRRTKCGTLAVLLVVAACQAGPAARTPATRTAVASGLRRVKVLVDKLE